MAKMKSELAAISGVAQLLGFVVTVAALFLARDVFIPLALGLLLSFLLSPIVNRLQRLGIPNVLAVVTTAALAFVILALGFTLLGRELTTLVGSLPKHKDELVAKARSLVGMATGMGGSLDELADEVSEAMEKGDNSDGGKDAKPSGLLRWADKTFSESKTNARNLPNDGTSIKAPLFVRQVGDDIPFASWASTAGTVLGPLATAGLVSVFALFILIHREDLRDRIIAVVSRGNYVTTTEALNEAATRISRYLVAQTIVNLTYGCIMTIGLVTIGSTMSKSGNFPNAILWGVLATCFRFVPYLGPIVAAIFPLTIAMAVFPGYGVLVAVLALIVTLELLSNNLLEPWLYGVSTGISAMAVIAAAVFWGWLWGPVGLLLSTPLTVCLVVLGHYVPHFKFLATLLGEDVEIKPSLRFYQRLLASDQHRAREMLLDYLKTHDLDATCDSVLIPIVKRIRSDHHANYLTETDANRLLALTGGLISDLQDFLQPEDDQGEHIGGTSLTGDNAADLPLVVGCASHHVSEALTLNLLRIGGSGSFQLQAMEDDGLPREVGRKIMETKPSVVVIVVLPPGGFAQARFLCKSIRSEGYSGPIVLCCLGKFKHFDRLFVRSRKVGATSMTTSYSQTRSKIKSLVEQLSTKHPRKSGVPQLSNH